MALVSMQVSLLQAFSPLPNPLIAYAVQAAMRATQVSEDLVNREGLSDTVNQICDIALPVNEDTVAQLSQAGPTKVQDPTKGKELAKNGNTRTEEVAELANPTADKAINGLHVQPSLLKPPVLIR